MFDHCWYYFILGAVDTFFEKLFLRRLVTFLIRVVETWSVLFEVNGAGVNNVDGLGEVEEITRKKGDYFLDLRFCVLNL